MKKVCLFTAGFLFSAFCKLSGQTIKIPLTLEHWDTIGGMPATETFSGKECLLIPPTGMIVAKDVELRDGTFEADVSFPRKRGFPGFRMRMQDDIHFESFYMRPHQSGNPDASQYSPEFNGLGAFQLYYGDGYSGAFPYRFNEWHHVKIDLHGLQAEFYIDDTLVIKVKELWTGWKSGKIAIIASGVPLRVANVQYTVKQVPAPAPTPVPSSGTGGIVTSWQVSNVVSEKLFEKKYQLTPGIKMKLTWNTQSTDPYGTINLARFSGLLSDTARTMVVKLKIESMSDQVKELTFGFSDFVTVYLNDKALYSGSDNFLSRDYRFLGTIGYFDKVFLPLKKGMNELWFVVSEQFGGWGIKAKFDSMDGITLK